MSIYYEKARELGNLILESDEAKKLNAAREIFDANPDAIKKLDEYSEFQNDTQHKVSHGELSQAEFTEITKKLTEMAAELKGNDVISSLINAEEEFNNFVNSILNVMRFTITGVDESDACGCHGCAGGSCDSCG